MYQGGKGVPQDYAEAVKWYRLAANQGDLAGQFNLGMMYEGGKGVPRDHAEAVKWFRKVADQGDARAQLFLGTAYAPGRAAGPYTGIHVAQSCRHARIRCSRDSQ